MYKLYFTIGCPRSGKSTIAKLWQNYLAEITPYEHIHYYPSSMNTSKLAKRFIVRADDIRLALGHRYNTETEEFTQTVKHLMIKALLKQGDVLVDGTHSTIKNIKKILYIDKNAIPAYIDTDILTCKSRAIATNQPDVIGIIDRIHNNLLTSFNNDLSITSINNVVDNLRKDIYANFKTID